MNQSELVIVEHSGSTCTITLNRPEARNALSQALNHELVAAVDDVDADPAVAVILLTGAGGSFCSGVDLKELAQRGFTGSEKTENCIDRVAACTTPVVGLVDGPAVTGGFELALACDFLIASATARFADTHSRVGIVPGGGLTARLAEAVGIRRARQLSATGQYVDAATALHWGLVNEVVEPEQLRDRGLAIAESFCAADPATLNQVWALYDSQSDDRLTVPLARETEINRTWTAHVSSLAESTAAVLDHGRAQNADRR
ncbi:enoyl-CoA hydratase [Gordonia insulae]|uniref:Short-chain-enoyl-CoA hydratase n=1 Tax=Gordonia insulae TaxID=2420509 RepID=A0A3G8JLR1_9ACTN|nr:enoyl-CoA hydratase [Gordonia insulae]AZG45512.1 Short-chain-enoyl-CoA hydratase [Gordonia insulae]